MDSNKCVYVIYDKWNNKVYEIYNDVLPAEKKLKQLLRTLSFYEIQKYELKEK